MPDTRSRAAVICLGGWGLQTMLHLWPRLHSIQEERQYLGIERHLANLKRLTSFAAILPQPLATEPDQFNKRPFLVLRPSAYDYPPPFLAERTLTDIFEDLARPGLGAGTQGLLYSERVAERLLDRLRIQPGTDTYKYLELVQVSGGMPSGPAIQANSRVKRVEMFRLGILWAETLARTIIRDVIDPTRLDETEPRDPFVQTNLYVIASLAEPLASALIWPIMAELNYTLGTRNVVKVIGLLATGSFAPDATRVIEESSAYAALAELETMVGVPGREASINALKELVKASAPGMPAWENRLGEMLFNRIYLLDREKSNQSLARDSLELTVLAGNAIESFLAADAETYIDRSLGAEANASPQALYSLIGAVNHYVPLPSYLRLAIEEERKRIAIRTILAEPQEPDLVQASLDDLNMLPQKAVRDLTQLKGNRVFKRVPARRVLWPFGRRDRLLSRAWFGRRRRVLPDKRRHLQTPTLGSQTATPSRPNKRPADWFPQLQVARDYIFTPSAMTHLRNQEEKWRWRAVAEAQATRGIARLQNHLHTTLFEEAWGLQYNRADPPDDGLTRTINYYHEQTWASRRLHGGRTLPLALYSALQYLVRDLSAGQAALRTARQRINGWIEEIDELLRTPRYANTQAQEWEEQDQDRYQEWQRNFVRVAAGEAHAGAIGIRAVLGGLFVAYLLVGWLLTEAPFPISTNELFIAGAIAASVMVLLGLLPLVIARFRWWRVRETRIQLALDRSSHLANYEISNTVIDVYNRLRADLVLMREPLVRAIEELDDWAKPQNPPSIPPQDILPSHLHVAYTDDRIWEQIKTRLQTQQDPKSNEQSAPDWFLSMWRRDGSMKATWHNQGDMLAQRIRLALEVGLNEVELVHVQALEARRRVIEATGQAVSPGATTLDLDSALKQISDEQNHNAWCGYASGPPNSLPTGHDEKRPPCTACPNCRFGCPFSKDGNAGRQRWSLSALIDDYLDRAVDHLIPKQRFFAGRPDFVNQLIKENSLERLMFGPDGSSSLTMGSRHLNRANGKDEDARQVLTPADFVEDLQARAKPSANYESDFSTSIVEVDFGVTDDSEQSPLLQAFEQRTITLLDSHDPLSISAVRTVNGLCLGDLLLADRGHHELMRMNADQRKDYLLLVSDDHAKHLYGDDNGVVHYGHINF